MRNYSVQVDKLKDYNEKSQFLLSQLESVPAELHLLDDWVPASLDKCVVKLREAAQKTTELANSPVKIGVMGEFSSGKTLLLGCLIGFADALPVSESPTTGNVTAIHLIPQEGLQTTEIDDYTVNYLSHNQVKNCLYFMLEEAERRAKAVKLSPPSKSTLKNPDDMLDWCKDLWNSSDNLQLRYLLRELVIFLRAYKAYGDAICKDHPQYKIDPDTAKEGLKLPEMPIAIKNLSFEELPQAPIKLPKAPQKLQASLLQKTFPLIKRVDIKVKISREIWNISTNQGLSQFILLDFPGLGAANSGVRDRYLSLQELKDVQTVLLLLNGKSIGGDRANEIFTMMQQERPGQDLKDLILVGIGRFNQLPLEAEGGERELDRLIEDDSSNQSLSETVVLEKLDVLRTTIDQAGAFTTEKDRIILLDQLMGIADLAKRSTSLTVASEQFLANLNYPGFLDQSKRMRDKWGELSQKLQDSDPRSTLAKQLNDFANDGGIGRLRELIQTHASTHGQRQLYEDTKKAYQALLQQQNELKREIAKIKDQGIPVKESQALFELRDAIRSLDKVYRNFQKNLGKEPLKNRGGVDVAEAVKEELIFKILNWNQWTLLFNKAKNGIITLPESKKEKRERRRRNQIPTKSEEFYPIFEKTIQELEIFADKCIFEAIDLLINQLSDEIAPQREQIQKIIPPEKQEELEQDIEAKLGDDAADLFNDLTEEYDSQKWLEEIKDEIKQEKKPIAPEKIFPLAREEDEHNPGTIFHWSPQTNQIKNIPANHQMLVLRLRDKITGSANLHLVEYVSKINQEVNQQLKENLDNIIEILQDISKNGDLLRYLADNDKESQQEAGIPNWLKNLSDIASTSLDLDI